MPQDLLSYVWWTLAYEGDFDQHPLPIWLNGIWEGNKWIFGHISVYD